MNFFTAQDRARRTSRRLVIAYAVATAAIVLGATFVIGFALWLLGDDLFAITFGEFVRTQMPLFWGIALVTTIFIVGASLFRVASLTGGGGAVAASMGGTLVAADVQDPLRRRLRNVVEEMAIASGVPVPEIYVLEAESGINAFAAGFKPGDAAIAVTRGALELLDRDELQGVIGHEFSHVLNGDMRINIRLMGILFGIMALGLIGRMILRSARHTSGRGAAAAFAMGAGIALLGAAGVLAARIIKAGVSRQREFLADASAVQFTRQTDGIAGALKKIGGYADGSTLRATDPEEVSHMLFGSGSAFNGLLSTHPPLLKRIQALDPSFQATDYPRVDPRAYRPPSQEDAPIAAAAGPVRGVASAGGANRIAESIADTVGEPDSAHVEFAARLRRSIPASLYDAAHSQELAYLLVVALVLDQSGQHVERQFAVLQERLGTERTRLVRRYFDELANTGAEFRLPLLAIAFPALRLRPAQHLDYLLNLTRRLIEIDDEISLYEYCFYRILRSNLGAGVRPQRARHRRAAIRDAAVRLLAILAARGHATPGEQQAALEAGLTVFGSWALDSSRRDADTVARASSIADLDRSLDVLLALDASDKEKLLRAISTTAAFDGRLALPEAELIRAVCATLEYPLPPILVEKVSA